MCGFASRLSILFQWSVCLLLMFLHFQHILNSETVISLLLFFVVKTALAIGVGPFDVIYVSRLFFNMILLKMNE